MKMSSYEFAKFKVPMGYVVPKEQGTVKEAKSSKNFLEQLLAKMRTTVTLENVQGARKMYFTHGQYLFTTEAVIKPKRSQIYGEALLAMEFLVQLQSYVCGNGEIIMEALQNERLQNLVTDFLATTLKPFLNPEFAHNGLQDAQFLINSIWENFMEIYQSEDNDLLHVQHLEESTFHPVSEYLSPLGHCEPVELKLFGVQFTWPSAFLKRPIVLETLTNAGHIPQHVRSFLTELCTKLETNVKLEGVNNNIKREFTHRHGEQIAISLYQWQWLTNCIIELQLKEELTDRDLRRTLKLFEADIAIDLYNVLLERLEMPVDVCETLELGETQQILQIVQSVVTLMSSVRDYEFKCLNNAWNTDDWKNHVLNYWSEVAQKKEMLKRPEKRRMSAGGEMSHSSPSSLTKTDFDLSEELREEHDY